MAVWFLSDTHFSDVSVLEQSRKSFGTLKKMNQQIISNWNNCVTDDDVVYHLGDFGYPETLGLLRCRELVLIRGNHDSKSVIARLSKDKRFRVGKGNEFYENEKLFKMVHKPCRVKHGKHFYLFGHSHSYPLTKENALNVGVDCHDFAPISLQEVLWWKHVITHKGDIAWGNLEWSRVS
jgi:calcineurin-like phosphoesterase family protein